MKHKLYAGAVALAIITGCVMADKPNTGKENKIQSQDKTNGVWYEGSVEQALAEAKTEKKSVLLYWGAVWCPPCAEIKSQVFSHPEFPNLVQDIIAVYIDGDAEGAQSYSDQFKAQGYPTLLVLNAQGDELMRIDHATSYAEFASALRSALASTEPIQALVARARVGKVSDVQWTRIAYQYGEELTGGSNPGESLVARHQLFKQCPPHLDAAKARLAGLFLSAAAGWSEEQKATETSRWKQVENDFNIAAKTMFASPASTVAARSIILYEAAPVLRLLAPDGASPAHAEWKSQWLEAAASLQQQDQLSIDTRLWTVYPELAIHLEFAGEDHAIPHSLKARIIAASHQADREATTEIDRKAVVSGAAHLLKQVGDFDAAREMLRKELLITKTPWYYQSSLSSLEEAAGNLDQALVWSEKARQSAEGRATKIQWIVNDLRLTAKTLTKSAQQSDRLSHLISEYYDTTFALSDGFSGRNAARARAVAGTLQPFAKDQQIARIWRSYQAKCANLPIDQAQTCQEHFAVLMADTK